MGRLKKEPLCWGSLDLKLSLGSAVLGLAIPGEWAMHDHMLGGGVLGFGWSDLACHFLWTALQELWVSKTPCISQVIPLTSAGQGVIF